MTSNIFPARWPVEDPSVLQLYSLATPNGQKVAIMLEEVGLPYEPHKVDIMANHQFDEDYVRINPNSKIPTLVDPDGPDGQQISIMESGAILQYLAQKTGKMLPEQASLRLEATQWLFFQMASIGPMFGQFGHFFKFAKGKTTDSYGVDRYTNEAKRLLGVLDRQLAQRNYLAQEYSIADIATFPWVMALDFYEGKDALDYGSFVNIEPWVQRCAERPAAQRGMNVCGFSD